MQDTPRSSLVLAFIAAVVVATVWGAIVQTQYNLAGLASIGAAISFDLRLRTTLEDIFGGFTPTYGGYVVAPSLFVAFVVVAWRVARRAGGSRAAWFGAAGGLAILLGIPVVNYLSPVALLIGATRDVTCTVLMALGGVAAGVTFVSIAGRRAHGHRIAEAPVAP